MNASLPLTPETEQIFDDPCAPESSGGRTDPAVDVPFTRSFSLVVFQRESELRCGAAHGRQRERENIVGDRGGGARNQQRAGVVEQILKVVSHAHWAAPMAPVAPVAPTFPAAWMLQLAKLPLPPMVSTFITSVAPNTT